MSRHLTDEDMILRCYGEAMGDDETVVEAHLAACESCQALWREIASTLELVDAGRVPEPDEGFEQAIWTRVQAAIARPELESLEQTSGPWLLASGLIRSRIQWVLPAAGLAAAVLIAVLVGRPSRPASDAAAPPRAPDHAALDSASRERVLLTALNDHFQQSEMLLVEVMNGGTASAELGFERETAGDLLDSSRLYRATAQQSGHVRLADMLEDLESVLVEIARSPDTVDRRDIRSLRTRIDEDNLLFKVRAVSKQIQERQRSLSTE